MTYSSRMFHGKTRERGKRRGRGMKGEGDRKEGEKGVGRTRSNAGSKENTHNSINVIFIQ